MIAVCRHEGGAEGRRDDLVSDDHDGSGVGRRSAADLAARRLERASHDLDVGRRHALGGVHDRLDARGFPLEHRVDQYEEGFGGAASGAVGDSERHRRLRGEPVLESMHEPQLPRGRVGDHDERVDAELEGVRRAPQRRERGIDAQHDPSLVPPRPRTSALHRSVDGGEDGVRAGEEPQTGR
ncbi:hypothetical protein GCM10027024_30520 [Microbacterium insulae]